MRFRSSIEHQYKWRADDITQKVLHSIHQRRLVQQKFHHKYHKYEIHDGESFCHDGFEGRTGIVSSHAKQDYKVQEISNGLYDMAVIGWSGLHCPFTQAVNTK